MGGIKNPFGGGQIGTGKQIVGAGAGSLVGAGIPGMIVGGKAFDQQANPQNPDEGGPAQGGTIQNFANYAEAEYQRAKENQAALAEQQKAFGQKLADQAAGKGPSVTELQLKSAMDRGLAQQVAAARANRSVNPALAARQVNNLAAQQQAQTAQAAGIQRLQEQQQNQGQFANYLAQQEQAKQAALGYGFQGAAGLEGADSKKRSIGAAENAQNNQMIGNLLGAGASIGGAFLGGPAGAALGGKLAGGLTPQVSTQVMPAPNTGYLGANTNFYDTSDKNAKKDIKESKDTAKSFLDALKSYDYKYKDGKNGKGEQFSVMAQDLEKAGPVGANMVEESPEGKKVNYGKGFAAILAAQVEMNDRLKQIEKKYGKKG